MVDSVKRTFLKKVNPQSNKLIIALHGADETDWMMMDQSLINLSFGETYSIIYPQGSHMQWNDARGVTMPSICNVDDIGFIDALIDSAAKWIQKDSIDTYLIGYSNGGLMAQTYALRGNRPIAGIASIAAPMPINLGKDTIKRSLKVIFFEGIDDPIMPFKRKKDAPEPLKGLKVNSCSGGYVFSAHNSGREWCEKLSGEHCLTPKYNILQPRLHIDSAVHSFDYSVSFGALSLVVLPKGGHQIPGGIALPKKKFGHYQYFPSIEHIYNFFEESSEKN